MRQKFTLVLLVIVMFTSCSSEQTEDNYIVDLHEEILDTYGADYLPSVEMAVEELTETFGIDSEYIVDYIAEKPIMSTHVDLFVSMEVKEESADQVVKAFEAYISHLKKNKNLSKSNKKKVEKAQIIVEDTYISLLILD